MPQLSNGTIVLLFLTAYTTVWPAIFEWYNLLNTVPALAQGNWGPTLLIALGTLCNGLFWEMWNWGSAHPTHPITNPNYWMYNIPYVNVIHIFSEMPLLGYMGYMPFGILAWVMFIWLGELFGFDTALLPNDRDRS